MPAFKRIWILGLAFLSLAAWGGTTVQVLETLTPKAPKKADMGYSVEGNAWHYRDDKVDFRLAFLSADERAAFFHEKGVADPFTSFGLRENLILFRVRIENLTDGTPVEFSPTAAMLGNSLAFDETYIFQYLYKEPQVDEKMAAAGKTVFLSHLQLPPGKWIERLIVFKYDDPYSVRTLKFVVQGLMVGPDGLNLEFPFKANFRKEKLP